MLQIFANLKGTSVMNFGINPQHDFPKMRGGGVKGRLELFRKFICFGREMLPLVALPDQMFDSTFIIVIIIVIVIIIIIIIIHMIVTWA